MSRLVIALVFATAFVGSFVAVTSLRRGEPGESAPPADMARPGKAAPARAAVAGAVAQPQQPAPPEAEAGAAESQAFLSEVAAAARVQEEAQRQKILAPMQATDTTLDEKLYGYRKALRENFEGTPKEELLRYRGSFTEIFLRADAVQKELAALAPGDREAALDHIRREMGFSNAEVARMEAADASRNARWENGLSYMQERQRIAGSFQGQPLQDELQHLRERYFGIAARTIALEEQSGFFRFERPRVYGVN